MVSVICYDSNGNRLNNLTQWDLNQKLVVKGATTTTVPVFHFCNKLSRSALVVTASVSGNDIIVKIPNILLQQSFPIIAYMYYESADSSAKTMHTITIPVTPRVKPNDYEFVENIDYVSFAMLDARLSTLLNVISENSTSASSAELVDIRMGHDGTVYLTAGDAVRVIGKLASDTNDELIDVRSAYDGTTYDTAGDAVRGQVVGLNNKIKSVNSELIDIRKAYNGTVYDTAGDAVRKMGELIAKNSGCANGITFRNGMLYLTRDGTIISNGVEVADDSGLAFDTGYVDDDGYLHLTYGGAEVEGFEPFYIGSAASGADGLVILGEELYLSKDGEAIGTGVTLPQGGGSSIGSTMKLTSLMEYSTFSVMDTESTVDIKFNWSSVDSDDGSVTGGGIAYWYVNGTRVALQSVEQGDCSFNIKPYLISGSQNTVKLEIEDSYGNIRPKTWKITVVSFGVTWNLESMAIHDSSDLSVKCVVTGTGEKTLHVTLDDNEYYTTVVTSTGRTTTVNVLGQTHGVHTLRAWIETVVDGQTITTEPLVHVGIWTEYGNTTPVVAVYSPEVSVAQFATTAIDYLVYDPLTELAAVNLYEDDVFVTALSIDRTVQTWAYRSVTVGTKTLTIECAETDVAENVEVTVTSIGYDINPITNGLVMDVDPTGHSNQEAARANFGYTDENGDLHSFTYSDNFDWTNGGFQIDNEGVTAFVVKRGTYVTFDRSFFDDVATTTGKELKLIYKTTNVRDYLAEFLTCYSGNTGLKLLAQQGILGSGSEETIVPYCEDQKIEMDINIEASNEDKLAVVWLGGTPSDAIVYASTDTWMQTTPQMVKIGSEDCDVWIYRIKMYKNSLTRFEVMDNYIADCGNTEEMVKRFERNNFYNTDGSINISKLSEANPSLRLIHIEAPAMTVSKENEITCDKVTLYYKNGGGDYTFTATNVIMKAQGTSSLAYGLAALNLDLDFSEATWTNGNGDPITSFSMNSYSIPVNYFNIKLNVASSESANNICLADDYNTFNPFQAEPRYSNNNDTNAVQKIRDTVEGNPCAVFLTNTSDATISVGARSLAAGETMLYGCGDMNNSKKNFAVFGQDNSKYPLQCCVEILNNNNDPCRFISDDLSTETWDGNEGTSDFEFRYPKNPTDEMKAKFQEVLSWVVSTNTKAATGSALTRPAQISSVTYNYDTAEYRAAKFVAELSNYFSVDSLLYHYLFTEYHCMVDNRAKNTFMSYEYDPLVKDYRWNFNKNYDDDTAAGTDNSGGLTFGYGIEDTDAVGAQMAFNASDSVLWCNIRDYMFNELRAMFIKLETAKLWNVDRILKKFSDYQFARPEALVAEDMWAKYFMPYILAGNKGYIEMAQGKKTEQRTQFYTYQRPYMSSKYYSSYATDGYIELRINEISDVDIVPYSDLYVAMKFGNADIVRTRAKRGDTVHIPCRATNTDNLETYIYSSKNISFISSLAGFHTRLLKLNYAEKLRNLLVGSTDPGYVNANLPEIGFGEAVHIEHIDISNITSLTSNMDLSRFTALEEFYAAGSGITGVIFAANAPLKTAILPSVTSVVMKNLYNLDVLSLDATKLTSIQIDNTPSVDTLSIAKAAIQLGRGRITDVDWTDDNPDVILRLAKLPGYDSEGQPVDTFVLSGNAHVTKITQTEIDTIHTKFPNLHLTYDTIVNSYTVTFQNDDGTVLNVQEVREGGDAVNPVVAGLISTPVKEPSVDEVYAFAGWDTDCTNVQSDLTVTAIYVGSTRTYTVRWWNESVLLYSEVVDVYSSVTYTGDDLVPIDDTAIWVGWDQDTSSVVSDMDVRAWYVTPTLPTAVATGYDYLYSDDPDDNSGYTLAEFYGIIALGQAKNYFKVGDQVKIAPDTNVFADSEIILKVYGFNHFKLADGSGEFAKVVFGMMGLMNVNRQMNSSNSNAGGWDSSDMRTYLNDKVFPALPRKWKAMIKTVEVLASEGGTSATIVTSEDKLFLFSRAEVGFNTTAVPYSIEVDPDAEELTFSIFTDNNSRIRKTYNGTGTAGDWWLRSPDASSAANFCDVGANGYSYGINTYISTGVSFGFCI